MKETGFGFRETVLGVLAIIGAILTVALFLYSSGPHSDVVSLEMHKIDAPAPSHGI
jgi:hypothetical protein